MRPPPGVAMSSAACAGVTVDQGTRALARRAGRHLLGDEGVRRAHPDEASLEGRARAANSRLSILVIDRHNDAGEEGADKIKDGRAHVNHTEGDDRHAHTDDTLANAAPRECERQVRRAMPRRRDLGRRQHPSRGGGRAPPEDYAQSYSGSYE